MCSKAEGAPVGFGSHFAQDLSSLNDKLIDSKIPSESGDQGENKLGQNELWDVAEKLEIGKGQEPSFADAACTEQLRKMETHQESA